MLHLGQQQWSEHKYWIKNKIITKWQLPLEGFPAPIMDHRNKFGLAVKSAHPGTKWLCHGFMPHLACPRACSSSSPEELVWHFKSPRRGSLCPCCSPNARFMPYDAHHSGIKWHGNICWGAEVRPECGDPDAEWRHPGTEPPKRVPSRQNKTKLISIAFFHTPTLFQAVTGYASSGINSPYLGCPLKIDLALICQVTTGDNFTVWTTTLNLSAVANTQDRFLFLFYCLVVLFKCKMLVRRIIIHLVSKGMAVRSET